MHTVQRRGLLLPMFRGLRMCVCLLDTTVNRIQKQMNRSRCSLRCGLGWVKKDHVLDGTRISPRKGALLETCYIPKHVQTRSSRHTQCQHPKRYLQDDKSDTGSLAYTLYSLSCGNNWQFATLCRYVVSGRIGRNESNCRDVCFVLWLRNTISYLDKRFSSN